MNCVIRTDASVAIGSGHVMRCLTLAEKLREEGALVRFVCRDFVGNLCDMIKSKGFDLYRMPLTNRGSETVANFGQEDDYAAWLGVSQDEDAAQTASIIEENAPDCDWLIVDHYGIDAVWQRRLRPLTKAVLVIDDLAYRNHDCDILLDQNLRSDAGSKYVSLLPTGCMILCGPPYALLRSEFIETATRRDEGTGRIRRIMVFFGGVDSTNETSKACRAIAELGVPELETDIVVGHSNPNRAEIETFCGNQAQFSFHSRVNSMAEMMAGANLAIGAGGTTMWERAYLGLPTITIAVADNQISGCEAMAKIGAVRHLGFHDQVSTAGIASALKGMLEKPENVVEMSRRAMAIFGDDPASGVKKVIAAMKKHALAPARARNL